MSYVLIAEKPDQAKKLAAPFKSKRGNGYIEVFPCETFPKGAYFTWCVGHLFGLQNPENYKDEWKKWSLTTLPILPEGNQFRYTIIKGKNTQYQVIKKLLKRPEISTIINGCDAGREGEYIFGLVVQMSGVKKPIKRLWTSSLTKVAVKKAFDNLLPGSKTRSLFYEAQARAIADWLVGLSTTRAYTLLLPGNKEVYSTGRIQTPLLALINKRGRNRKF